MAAGGQLEKVVETGQGPHLGRCGGAEWEQPACARCLPAAKAGTITDRESVVPRAAQRVALAA